MKRLLTWLGAIAVIAGGSAAASAAPVTGPHWIVQTSANRTAPESFLENVSCTTNKACMAVGFSGPFLVASPHGSTAIRSLTERWDGAHWRIEPSPNPAGSTETFLNAVTCTSSHACTAVGSAISGGTTVPLAERWNGSHWSIERTPRPPKFKSGEFEGVSCPALNECIAVGGFESASNVSSGFTERWNGSRWANAGVIRLGTQAFVDSVSCPSATRCTAVGDYQPATTPVPLALRWSGGSWHKQQTSGSGFLESVSCATLSRCTAVGAAPNGAALMAMQWNGGAWKATSVPEPGGVTTAFLRGVTCPTANSCEAAGWASLTAPVTTTVAEHWNGTKWTLELTPSLTGAVVAQFAGVSCGVHVACRAVGSVQESAGSHVKTLIEHR